jgi:hypothetical protein
VVGKQGIVLGRNAPLLLQPRLEFVFFLGWQAYLDGRGILREDEWQIGKGAVP